MNTSLLRSSTTSSCGYPYPVSCGQWRPWKDLHTTVCPCVQQIWRVGLYLNVCSAVQLFLTILFNRSFPPPGGSSLLNLVNKAPGCLSVPLSLLGNLTLQWSTEGYPSIVYNSKTIQLQECNC